MKQENLDIKNRVVSMIANLSFELLKRDGEVCLWNMLNYNYSYSRFGNAVPHSKLDELLVKVANAVSASKDKEFRKYFYTWGDEDLKLCKGQLFHDTSTEKLKEGEKYYVKNNNIAQAYLYKYDKKAFLQARSSTRGMVDTSSLCQIRFALSDFAREVVDLILKKAKEEGLNISHGFALVQELGCSVTIYKENENCDYNALWYATLDYEGAREMNPMLDYIMVLGKPLKSNYHFPPLEEEDHKAKYLYGLDKAD